MTVSSATNRASYSGNGSTTAFAYGFKIFADSDLTVILRSSTGVETTQTLTTHYTVSGAGVASGGNVTFGSAPASGVTVVILREQPLTQGLDLVANDPFPSASVEDSLDKLTFMVQQHDEELGRAIKASKTNVISNADFTVSSTDRANKVFSFDASGNLAVTQELGIFKGNWAASTAYVVRDLIKDTNTNNIFIVNAAHTSSGSQPLTTNANSAKYTLIVDAASAASSATAAASSATASANSATASASSSTASTAAKDASVVAKDASVVAKDASVTAKNSAETALASFTGQYSTGSSDPTSNLNTGDLFYNSSTNLMKVYTGSAWVALTPSSSNQTNINALAASAVIEDMSLLATTAVIADMALLATSDVISDLNTLATSDVVSDLNTLATSDIVSDINTLATSDIVSDLNTLATTDIVTDLNLLATSAIVTDLNLLATSAVIADMAALAGSGANPNITSLTASGEIAAASLDISGNVDIDGTTNLDVVDIDGSVVMASTLDVAGVVTANAGVVVDNITIDGTEIDLSSGNLTVDVAGYLILNNDADGLVIFSDASVDFGLIKQVSSDFVIEAGVQNKDILFKGNDNGATITALTLDMSDAGRANFNSDIGLLDGKSVRFGTDNDAAIFHTGSEMKVANATGDFTLDVATNIVLDADGGGIYFKDDGTTIGFFQNDGGDFRMISSGSDKDIKFLGNDGGSTITALTLDMSAAGNATFNGQIRSDPAGSIILDSSSNIPNLNFFESGAQKYAIGESANVGGGGAGFYDHFAVTGKGLRFFTGSAERMRITSGGNLLVGTSTTGIGTEGTVIYGAGNEGVMQLSSTNMTALYVNRSNAGELVQFRTGGSSTVGSISTNGSATAFNTSSDYRLKENVDYDWDATTRLKQLKPARFNFIADADTTVDGFLAHEAQAVVPECVTGTKDEVDGDGVAVMQGIDQSKLVPLLVKTIQELEARITALEG